MNIWIVNQYAIPPTEPGGTRHYALAKQLGRRGHRVTIIASNVNHATGERIRGTECKRTTSTQYDGVHFLFFRVPPYSNRITRVWNMLDFALRVWHEVPDSNIERPDVIIGSSLTLFAALAAYRIAKRLYVPFVLEIRDLWPQTLIDMGVSALHPIVILSGTIERYLYRHSPQIITLLPNAAAFIASRGGNVESITWIPNGVDLPPAPPEPVPGIQPFTIMYAGSHGLTDALDSVIDAAAKLDRSLPGQFRFRLIGRGPAKAGLQRRAQERGIGNVVFEDPVPKSEMPSILAQANAFIIALKQTDLYQYGISPNKLHEYMAAARPTILAGDCPHNPIREAGAGLTVAPEDPEAIARAAKELASMSDEQRTWIGLRGRKYVEEFHDFSKLADSLESVLLRVIETGGSVNEINDGIRGRKLPTLGV